MVAVLRLFRAFQFINFLFHHAVFFCMFVFVFFFFSSVLPEADEVKDLKDRDLAQVRLQPLLYCYECSLAVFVQ